MANTLDEATLPARVESLFKVRLSDFQHRAIEEIEKTKDNVIVVAPTGAGKTIIGYAALLMSRGFYLSPLISLMNEKYKELRKAMTPLGKTVVMTNRDFRLPFTVVKNADIRVMSPYKFLTYLPSLRGLNNEVVVVDEFHKLSEDPLFEAAVTLARALGFRIIALSATINEDDLSKLSRWLNARVIVEKRRPVRLVHEKVKIETSLLGDVYSTTAVKYGDRVIIGAGERFPNRFMVACKLSAMIYSITKKPVIVWAPTRRLVETMAFQISKMLPEDQKFKAVAARIAGTNPSENLLKYTVRHGVWIHHGGLGYSTREFVETKYKEMGGIMVTAYTLSHGVNMPGTFLIISTLFDYAGRPITPTLFHQVSGRAGRPGFDDIGIVITIVHGKSEEKYYEYILSKTAAKIEPKLFENELAVVKISLPVYAETGRVEEVEKMLRGSYSAFLGADIAGALEVVKKEIEYYSGQDKRLARAAMSMGLHHLEYEGILQALGAPDYKTAVEKVAEKACALLGVDVSEVINDILKYGFLASWFGNVKSRAVADTIQTILESGVFWAARVYGWKSREREVLTELSMKFAYAGNPLVEPLSRVLRIDALRRVIKSVPALLDGASEEDARVLTPIAVKEVFMNRKTVRRKKVEEIAKLVYYAMTGKHPDPQTLSSIIENARTLLSESGTKVT